jgi:cellulose synthase operon protein YhjQ
LPFISGIEAGMEQQNSETAIELQQGETPEDVAVLYSWANLQGAKYRDFSASRREYRAAMRHRQAEVRAQSEIRAQAEAEAAAAAAEKASHEAEDAARYHEAAARQAVDSRRVEDSALEEAARQRAMRAASDLARRASMERVEAARRAEAVAVAEAATRREAREIEEARASAQRQAQRYHESEVRLRSLAGPQPEPLIGGIIDDPYTFESTQSARPDRIYREPAVPEDIQPQRFRQSREMRVVVPQPGPGPMTDFNAPPREYYDSGTLASAAGLAAAGEVERYESSAKNRGIFGDLRPVVAQPLPPQEMTSSPTGYGALAAQPDPYVARSVAEYERARVEAREAERKADEALVRRPRGYQPDERSGFMPTRTDPASIAGSSVPYSTSSSSSSMPAWIDQHQHDQRQHDQHQHDQHQHDSPQRELPHYASDPQLHDPFAGYQPPSPAAPRYAPRAEPVRFTPEPQRAAAYASSPVDDTLVQTRERVAARWFALKGVFDGGQTQPASEPVTSAASYVAVPMLTVFSLAGGVGKTSLVATLGRALSSSGEKVLLADTTSHGLLPFYFGASELRPGMVRTFSPPSGSTDAPIYLVSYDVQARTGDAASQEWFSQELAKSAGMTQRVLLDMGPSVAWIARRLVRMNATVLVPVAPDMNSVISLQAVEKFFTGMVDEAGRSVQPYYVLNQFDASLPLHLDVREVMRRQLGDRLLPFVIRRSPSVAEALAEGMTVMDYAPDSPVAGDYMNLASWLRTLSAPAQSAMKHARWSER